MNRYIDANENQYSILYKTGVEKQGVWEDVINKMPTADLVEIVRCKDCKYMTEHYDIDGNAPYWTCSEWDSGTDYDGFCSYGERADT